MPKEQTTTKRRRAKKITIETIEKHYRRSGRFMAKWRKEAEEDLRFCLGEQWKAKIKDEIELMRITCANSEKAFADIVDTIRLGMRPQSLRKVCFLP